MRNRVGIVLCIFIGSFFLYCSQSAMTGLGRGNRDGGSGGGPVGDALAQSSGSGPQTFTKLAEGDFSAQNLSSGIINVAGYHNVVFYWSGDFSCATLEVYERLDASSPFGQFMTFSGSPPLSMRFPVDGTEMRLDANYKGGTCTDQLHYIVAGVSN
jgi:hypothetical protein